MSNFNHQFWEINPTPCFWETVCTEDGLWHESEGDHKTKVNRRKIHRKVYTVVRKLLDSHLTGRQKTVLNLYFLERRTQLSIAKALGISQPTVCQHLIGKMRRGKRTGGAIPKIKKSLSSFSKYSGIYGCDSGIRRLISSLIDISVTRREIVRYYDSSI